jgi:hypothetical protein
MRQLDGVAERPVGHLDRRRHVIDVRQGCDRPRGAHDIARHRDEAGNLDMGAEEEVLVEPGGQRRAPEGFERMADVRLHMRPIRAEEAERELGIGDMRGGRGGHRPDENRDAQQEAPPAPPRCRSTGRRSGRTPVGAQSRRTLAAVQRRHAPADELAHALRPVFRTRLQHRRDLDEQLLGEASEVGNRLPRPHRRRQRVAHVELATVADRRGGEH